jgi:hypothetical protein
VNAWAETSVKEAGGEYPPCSGDACGGCKRELHQGERVFRLCKPDEIRVVPAEDVGGDPWVCETCLAGRPQPTAARQAGGVAKDLQGIADEWPYPDDPPDPL